jgi:hypothetical protein
MRIYGGYLIGQVIHGSVTGCKISVIGAYLVNVIGVLHFPFGPATNAIISK